MKSNNTYSKRICCGVLYAAKFKSSNMFGDDQRENVDTGRVPELYNIMYSANYVYFLWQYEGND